ncbi:glycerol dehydratase reactivase beta/small subunit family protein [Mycolicibacterium neoaurum]|uniref:glycerol dehydratase reactivase beta/small subunit family protein n=1 Tax=Mycolicibacterium neoaurum TaxID=1795 RepID=UPI002673E443|nr:glycerol dehydratase reactivase beta/small subunit family protein [Mycolicibacterium neoaurum]MDO3401602.1 glycerol dehydratase reactivase beta/small subunit family protein [Mycolicibacterium neoaurum]
MLEGGQPDKPAILVLTSGHPAIENEVLAGIEEEGVPYVIERLEAGEPAIALARHASDRSSLEVGVGIDRQGRVAILHAKLRAPVPGLYSEEAATPELARIAGHNAARIVVGIPLRESRR